MPEELSIQPTVLAELGRQIASRDTTGEDIFLPLRALQRLGLSSADLRVHIERIRAANDVTADDDAVEENCLLALDMITGTLPHEWLRWDSAETARIFLPKVVRPELLSRGLTAALKPSDMLPPRPAREIKATENADIVGHIMEGLSLYDIAPRPADLYRVPKAGMTTRPAALLAPNDRVIFEALALEISEGLERSLPDTVIWPRASDSQVPYSAFATLPESWDNPYVIVTDIESFYECIDHTLLASFVGSELGKHTQYLKALESFLDATMSSRIGLPQGPNASDVFASAYLLPIDDVLANQNWLYARYADDFIIGAHTIVDGRRKIESLEGLLRQAGLRLNVSKTKVMRRDTYLGNLNKPSQQVERLRKEIRDLTISRLRDSDDEQELEAMLGDFGVDEEIMSGLFYNHTLTLDDVLEDVGDLFVPSLVDSYGQYFNRQARRLGREKLPDDMLGTERDLRECLIILSGASKFVPLSSVDDALKWFPRLAQHASAYLRSIASGHARAVGMFLVRWLDPPADTDWVTAWLCNVAEFYPALVTKRLQDVMTKLVEDSAVGLLTRTGAARALAAAGKLDPASYDALMKTSTAAIRSELIFSMADGIQHPNLRPEIE